MDKMSIVIYILEGLVTLIPMLIALVKFIIKSVKEKNWKNLLQLAMNLMAEAETKFDDGASRKEWVLSMIRASAKSLNYDIDEETLSALIDSLIELTNTVNVKK